MHQFLKFVFGIKLHVTDSSSVHHQEFFTVHTAMVYVIQVAESKLSANLYDIYHSYVYSEKLLYDIHHCCVYSEKLLMMDRGTVWNM